MQIGMLGLGRMGANMVRRLLAGGHRCVVFDRDPAAAQTLIALGAVAAPSLAGLIDALPAPRTVWIMLPARVVEETITALASLLAAGDCIIDGGNSPFEAAIRRAQALRSADIDFVDVGVSGGVWGLERGYCLMIGGPPAAVDRLKPLFETLAPGRSGIAPKVEAAGSATDGYLHCGPSGAGHFVKMVHNGIEYGLMAAYAEGFNLLQHAGAGLAPDASTEHAERYRYSFDLPPIAELWRRGSVVGSWLLDLTAAALGDDPGLQRFEGRVEDSGEGRWTLKAGIDTAVPMPVISAALHGRFDSRGEADFADRLLSAMRWQFGGHQKK